MVAGAAKSAELTDEEWLKMLRDIGERDGYFSSLGRDHSAVFVEDSHDVLFDLQQDPQEKHNAAGDENNKQIVRQLRERLMTWRQDTKDPLLAK